jgi:small subunit ribosomal protein S1
MINNRQLVYDKAEEMAAKYREKMLAQQQGATAEPEEPEVEVQEEEQEELIAAVEE